MLQTYALASASHQQRLTHRAARCLIFIPAGISVPARVAHPRACPEPSSQRAPTSPLAGRRGSTVQPQPRHLRADQAKSSHLFHTRLTWCWSAKISAIIPESRPILFCATNSQLTQRRERREKGDRIGINSKMIYTPEHQWGDNFFHLFNSNF